MRFVGTVMLALACGSALAQDSPELIARKDLPKKAICAICEGEGEESVAAGIRYRGKSFYFCNVSEVDKFKANPDSYIPPAIPRPAGALPIVDLEGTKKSLADYKGKVVLVDFWATWCAPCIKSMPELQKLHSRLSSRGFTVLGVSVDEEGAKKVIPFLSKRKLTYPILLDESGGWKKWGVKAIPAIFLINKEGQIVRQWVGSANKGEVEKAVLALL